MSARHALDAGDDDAFVAAARAGFLDEAADNLRLLEHGLLQLEARPDDREALHAAFRAAHTLKGAAGLFGLDAVVRQAHTLEGTLDALRDGLQPLDPATMATLLQGADRLGTLVAALPGQADAPADAPADEGPHWHLHLAMGADALRNGLDPLGFIRHLDTLATVHAVQADATRLPPLDTLDPEDCWLDFSVTFDSSAPRSTIEAVFDFLQDDCTLRLEAATPAAAPPPTLPASPVPPATADTSRYIRVRADKLDRLMDLIGELVTAGAGASSAARQERSSVCIAATERVDALVQAARDGALALRMVPVGQVFSRFQRVVRDVGQALGKDVALELLGTDTELDRSMVEALADPLLHLVRNSLDHGLESPPERLASGKPARGLLRLQARHEGGGVVIEVRDDGRGLDRHRIQAKAAARGLLPPGAVLDDAQVHALLFEPGFSTAERVTDLSGRGVGMDVVRRQVEALRGQILLHSTPGQGTCVQIRLPLTLAIIDGFLTRVGGVAYVVPLDLVAECIETPPSLRADGSGQRAGCLDLRGRTVPYLDLRHCLGHTDRPPARQSLLLVRDGRGLVGLLVDRLLGEHQTVLKPLGPLFGHLPGLAGSTLLGHGEVALVLDIPALVRRHAAPLTSTPPTRTPRASLASECP